MSTIHFETKLFEINSWTIFRLPESASAKLPSRGMTMVSGTINGAPFKAVLEPDGRYAPGQKPSHWFRPDEKLLDEKFPKMSDKRWQPPPKPRRYGQRLVHLLAGTGFAGYALSKHRRPAKSISQLRSTNSTKE